MSMSLNHPFEKYCSGGSRIQRGRLGFLILYILRDKPMHGYEIITTLEERSHGFWRPSAGSIYPSLQLLEKQGWIVGEDVEGKKVFSLTPAGHEEAERVGKAFPWGRMKGKSFLDLRKEIGSMFHALKTISQQGSAQDIAEARATLQTARMALERIANQKDK